MRLKKILAESANRKHCTQQRRLPRVARRQSATVASGGRQHLSITEAPHRYYIEFSGDVGVLLNMLAAIGLDAADVHKTSWVQDAPAFTPNS